MAINKKEIRGLTDTINHFLDSALSHLPTEAGNYLKTVIMGAAYGEIEDLIIKSKPPVMLLMGRSGHGKSSLINALANKPVAEVSDAAPCSNAPVDGDTTYDGAIPYCITFEKTYAEWQIIDTRGIFETTPPDGATDKDPVDLLKHNINEYDPDILMHIITMPEARALSNDLKLFKDNFYAEKPTIAVLTKTDTVTNTPRQWPPEEYAAKAGAIKRNLDYFSETVLKTGHDNIDPTSSIKGYHLSDKTYIAVVPISVCEGEVWNVDTLASLISDHLPKSKLLDFAQATKSKKLLNKLSSSLIGRFATIAGGIGASPIPISDIFVLIPLQALMVSIIAGLSCRRLTTREDVETAMKEFVCGIGVNFSMGFGLRLLSQQLSKLLPVPVLGDVLSGAIASSGTFGLGKAAEAYFFFGETKRPKQFEKQWEKVKGELESVYA